MPTRILALETTSFKAPADLPPDTARADSQAFPALAEQHHGADTKDCLFVLAPAECRSQSAFSKALRGPNSICVMYFQKPEDISRLSAQTIALASDSRATGVKECLPKGSTIYSESFFNANMIGSKLDPCFQLARKHLPPSVAVNAWGCLQSLVFFGLQTLPDQGEKGTGERVDVQIGGDKSTVALTVRFDLPQDMLQITLDNPLLSLPRVAAGIFECRYLMNGNKMEFNCLFFGENGPLLPVEAIAFRREPALESTEAVKTYNFRNFGTLAAAMGEKEEKRVVKGGFKKKFSENVKVAGPAPAAEEATTIKGGSSAAPEQKIVVSGASGLGKANETMVVKGGAPADNASFGAAPAAAPQAGNPAAATAPAPSSPAPALEKDKNIAVLESKIQGLEDTVKQRDELVAKLNKEIEEIKDPMKMGVISGIKDNHLEGLRSNLDRVRTELEESQKREKELMAMVDKAIQIKDEALKRIKELEVKVKQSAGGKTSQVVMLEKQLDEQKRQNKEMNKRLGTLLKQLQEAGIRPAA
jgi:hypothetical protein